jgi:hypothetical protein
MHVAEMDEAVALPLSLAVTWSEIERRIARGRQSDEGLCVRAKRDREGRR